MGVLSPREQELFGFAKSALPKWLFAQETNRQELIAGFAKAMGAVWDQIDFFVDQVFILKAVSNFLDDLAKDRGTRRQFGETDISLAARLRQVQDAVTLPALEAALTAIMNAAGYTTGFGIVELRADRAYLTTVYATIVCPAPGELVNGQTFELDNNGTGSFGTPIVYEFNTGSPAGGHVGINYASAVTAADVAALVVAAINGSTTHLIASTPDALHLQVVKVKTDQDPERAVQAKNNTVTAPDFSLTTGRHSCYLGRGYRVSSRHNELIVILPYGTPQGIQQAVADMIRLLHAGGVDVTIEVRANP